MIWTTDVRLADIVRSCTFSPTSNLYLKTIVYSKNKYNTVQEPSPSKSEKAQETEDLILFKFI